MSMMDEGVREEPLQTLTIHIREPTQELIKHHKEDVRWIMKDA